jgi:hypothetical protein
MNMFFPSMDIDNSVALRDIAILGIAGALVNP